MRQVLKAGAELDLLTADELQRIIEETLSGWNRPPQRMRPVAAIQLDASGNSVGGRQGPVGAGGVVSPSVVSLWDCPQGYSFRLHRMTLHPDGITFGAPFVNAAGFIEIIRGGLMQDGISFATPGLPLVWSAGTADAIDFTNGESVDVKVTGGPANTALSIRMQGTLEPIVRQ